jgi:phospholipase C
VRPSRALPYVLHVFEEVAAASGELQLRFANQGRTAAAVFHVYDRLHLERMPRRYTVEPGKSLRDAWQATNGEYDVWVLGPNGFHRHFTGKLGDAPRTEILLRYDRLRGDVRIELRNHGSTPASVMLESNAYEQHPSRSFTVGPGGEALHVWSLRSSGYWYDFTATVEGLAGYSRRFAGRVETGRDSISDPALGGPASGEQWLL